MPKKRKTQLKPVARGFATTSIPKKAIQVEEIAPPVDGTTPSDGLVTEAAQATADHQATLPGALRDSEQLVVEHDEHQSLQIMVDKYQERTEKEISRTIKACSPRKFLSLPLTLYTRRLRWISVLPEDSIL